MSSHDQKRSSVLTTAAECSGTPLVMLEALEGRVMMHADHLESLWKQDGGKGRDVELTYSYSNLYGLAGGLSNSEIRATIEQALGLWSSYAPLVFREVPDAGPPVGDDSYDGAALPQIRFGRFDIPDPRGTVLAEAAYPGDDGSNGDVKFDDKDSFGIGTLLLVATHEIGHALGLKHANGDVPEDGPNAGVCPPAYASIMQACTDTGQPLGHLGEPFGSFGTGFLFPEDAGHIQEAYGAGLGFVYTADQTLILTGTGDSDSITVDRGTNHQFAFSVNGRRVETTRPVRRLVVEGLDGNDTIDITRSEVPVEVRGGRGDDLINVQDLSDAATATVLGGSGTDTVWPSSGAVSTRITVADLEAGDALVGSPTASDGAFADRVRVSWPRVPGAVTYGIVRDGQQVWGVPADPGAPTISWDDPWATAGEVHEYEINAVFGNHTGAPNRNLPGNDTGYKQSVFASDGSFTDHIHLSWSSVPGAKTYGIVRDGQQVWGVPAIDGTPTLTWDDISASAGEEHTYSINAVFEDRLGGDNRNLPGSDTGYKQSVLASDGTFTDRVRISWPQVPGAVVYEVWRGPATATSRSSAQGAAHVGIVRPQSGGDMLTWDDEGAPTGVEQRYFIVAVFEDRAGGENRNVPGSDVGHAAPVRTKADLKLITKIEKLAEKGGWDAGYLTLLTTEQLRLTYQKVKLLLRIIDVADRKGVQVPEPVRNLSLSLAELQTYLKQVRKSRQAHP